MRWLLMCAALCAPVFLNAESLIGVESPRVRETLPAQSVSSAYLTVVNRNEYDVILTGAASDRSPRVEIHEHRHENGMMKMRKLESIVVPAQGSLVFETGGLHLMLFDLPAPLKVGEAVSLELQFGDGNGVTVEAPVQGLQQTLQAPTHSHH